MTTLDKKPLLKLKIIINHLPIESDDEPILYNQIIGVFGELVEEIIGEDIRMNFRVEDLNFDHRRKLEDALNKQKREQRQRKLKILGGEK